MPTAVVPHVQMHFTATAAAAATIFQWHDLLLFCSLSLVVHTIDHEFPNCSKSSHDQHHLALGYIVN